MRPTALVTGAARGIGRGIAEALDADAWVAALDREFPTDDGPGCVQLTADVSDRNGLDQVVSKIVAERGGLDWVVCAAGIVRDRVSWKMSDDDWDEVLKVNLTGAFNTVRATLPHLKQSDRGRIVLIGSINGTRGRFGQTNYAASKAGLVGLAKSLALELARDGVTVNVVTPGFIDTPMTQALSDEAQRRAVERTPLGRMGKAADVAAAARFFCSDAAGFITGTVLPVDGGQLLGSAT
ncbi:MAG: SDR family oxidoreductase [Gemmatimonadota bacterium]|nr:SDR family oxidoreductase [Gemmatimonadota bacterium]MDH5804811.1 SDR family oxidoreductase [Gemmatimonadota bacterium]